jgi:hypothetical protein
MTGAAAGTACASPEVLERFHKNSVSETRPIAIAAIASHFRAGILSAPLAEFRVCRAIGRGSSDDGLERAGLPVTPGMLGSCGLNGSCFLGSSDTVKCSVVTFSLIWSAAICKQADALYVNGSAAS